MQHFLSFIITLITIYSYASDHIDGPITKKTKVADLSDLYVFKSLSSNEDKLVLILNTYPLVGAGGHFSEKVNYEFIIKTTDRVLGNIIEENKITCSFKELDAHQFLNILN